MITSILAKWSFGSWRASALTSILNNSKLTCRVARRSTKAPITLWRYRKSLPYISESAKDFSFRTSQIGQPVKGSALSSRGQALWSWNNVLFMLSKEILEALWPKQNHLRVWDVKSYSGAPERQKHAIFSEFFLSNSQRRSQLFISPSVPVVRSFRGKSDRGANILRFSKCQITRNAAELLGIYPFFSL